MDKLPRLVCKLKTPQIIWYQTDITIVIRIILCDVKNYYVRVEYDYFQFSTTLNGTDYCLYLPLFGTVLPEQTFHENIGREIKIHLLKAQKCFEWLRLQLSTEKYKLITVDPDHIYETDWSNPRKKLSGRESFADYKKRYNITNIMPAVPSSDEEESDDEKLPFISADC